jgi:hypothetical protein
MSQRSLVLWAALVGSLLIGGPAVAQGKKKIDLHELLAREIETKNFNTPMSLQDFVRLFYDIQSSAGLEFPIVIDAASFQMEGVAEVFNAQVALSSNPRTMPASKALQMAVDQLPGGGAFILRNGAVEIVHRHAATLKVMLWQKVLLKLDEAPLADALARIAEQSGVSIVVDPRAKDKRQTPISADFRGDATVESALRMVANMADLKIVLMDRGVFVTTPENATLMEKELDKRRKDRETEDDQDPRARGLGGAASLRLRTNPQAAATPRLRAALDLARIR